MMKPKGFLENVNVDTYSVIHLLTIHDIALLW